MKEIKDFSVFDYSGDNIAATTVVNSNKAVKQNLGIYRKKTKDGIKLYTGRYCGITWLRDKNGTFIQDQNGEKQPLVISPRFRLDIDRMITKISEDEEYMMFDPIETWKKTRLMPGEFKVRELLKPVFIKGQCVYTSPSVMEIRAYCEKELNTLWDETRRLVNPHEVHVDLTQRLWDAKKKLLDDYNNALQTNKHATELK